MKYIIGIVVIAALVVAGVFYFKTPNKEKNYEETELPNTGGQSNEIDMATGHVTKTSIGNEFILINSIPKVKIKIINGDTIVFSNFNQNFDVWVAIVESKIKKGIYWVIDPTIRNKNHYGYKFVIGWSYSNNPLTEDENDAIRDNHENRITKLEAVEKNRQARLNKKAPSTVNKKSTLTDSSTGIVDTTKNPADLTKVKPGEGRDSAQEENLKNLNGAVGDMQVELHSNTVTLAELNNSMLGLKVDVKEVVNKQNKAEVEQKNLSTKVDGLTSSMTAVQKKQAEIQEFLDNGIKKRAIKK